MSARSTMTLHQEVRMKIVLDLGNVTVYFKPVEYLRGLGYDEARIPELKHAIFDSQPWLDCDAGDRKSTRLNSSHSAKSRMPSSA